MFIVDDLLKGAAEGVGSALGGFVDLINPLTWMNKHQQKDEVRRDNYWKDRTEAFNAAEAERNRAFQSEEARLSREFNSLEADKQRDWAFDMVNAQNIYDSPIEQLKRMEKAGLNPNLFDGTLQSGASPVGTSAASASGSPSGSTAQVNHGSVSPAFQFPIQDFTLSQTRLNNALANKADKEAEKTQTETERIKSLLNGELKLQNSRYNLDVAEKNEKGASARKLLKECEAYDAQISATSKSVELMQAQIDSLVQQGQLAQKEIDAFDSRLQYELAKVMSETAKNYSDINLNDAEIRHIASQVTFQTLQNGVISLDYDLKDRTHEQTVHQTIKSLRIEDVDNSFDLGTWSDQGVAANAVGAGRFVQRSVGRVLGQGVKKFLK